MKASRRTTPCPKGGKGLPSVQGRRNLPWHNRKWLQAEMARLGTAAAVAREHGIRLSTLYNYMSRHKIRAPRSPKDFGRPLKDPQRPSRTTLWRWRKRGRKGGCRAPGGA